MLRRTALALSIAFVLAACGGAPAPVPLAADEPAQRVEPRPPPPVSIAPFAGQYSLSGEATEDGCGGEIVLIARALEIDAESRTLRADVVEHDYEAHMEGDHLVATGRFDVTNGCPESTVYERWELDRAENGALAGWLWSTWLIWPSCMRVCTVRFSVRAEPESSLLPRSGQ